MNELIFLKMSQICIISTSGISTCRLLCFIIPYDSLQYLGSDCTDLFMNNEINSSYQGPMGRCQ